MHFRRLYVQLTFVDASAATVVVLRVSSAGESKLSIHSVFSVSHVCGRSAGKAEQEASITQLPSCSIRLSHDRGCVNCAYACAHVPFGCLELEQCGRDASAVQTALIRLNERCGQAFIINPQVLIDIY
jgi:hypothetical protein